MQNKIKKSYPVIALLSIGLVVVAFLWYFEWRNTESTDNAYTQCNFSVLSPKVSGYIKEVYVNDNHVVKKGQPLIKIDDRDYLYKVKSLEASINGLNATIESVTRKIELQRDIIKQAKANIDKSQANLDLSKKDYERTKHLVKDDFTPQQQFDARKAGFITAKSDRLSAEANLEVQKKQLQVLEANLKEAQAQLEQAHQSLNQARYDLENTTMCAPYDGVIGNKSAQIGEFITTGRPALSVVPVHDTYVVANFKETQIMNMRPGQKAHLTFDTYPGKTFVGRIDSLSPATGAQFSLLPPQNATGNFTKIIQRVPVKITLENSSKEWDLLRPGLSVFVKVDTRSTPKA
ncbi:HlyD family secretion protein [Candidatus Nucleicultrix amoebiphila]|jgi:membrane fusion protein (multidrug efflux system)|uniref:RND efflux pump membrane fusion protein barrel-sandwich domain-containing protein n=1 Tax=Candidatus Nucleicultrix amoebiphila FS5 TaxID=1414854 RepID=A0A1W6N5M7_9PROT|nr:HlyD family secretion protein [Candidatus Nucleicultrix amoebiphila]ARN85111.1 hypothetical protein GQ61_07205 [Candidatus Nucleicultrix amoebiphila FS5]